MTKSVQSSLEIVKSQFIGKWSAVYDTAIKYKIKVYQTRARMYGMGV